MFNTAAAKPYRTKEEFVYEVLRAAILTGELRPGDKLVIDTLRDELGVSTIPIRTTLQRLEAEGLVEIRPHSSAIVSRISLQDVAEIFTLLQALESVAFEAAAERVTPESLAEIQAIVQSMDAAVAAEDPDEWAALNTQFHLAVAQLAAMPLLKEFTARVLDRWDRLRSLYLREYILSRMAAAQADHKRMVELLRGQKIAELSTLARQHNLNALESFRAYTAQADGAQDA